MKKVFLILVTSLMTQLTMAAANKTGLTLDVYNADSGSFGVNATLVYGETEALLVDTGFTKADALGIGIINHLFTQQTQYLTRNCRPRLSPKPQFL